MNKSAQKPGSRRDLKTPLSRSKTPPSKFRPTPVNSSATAQIVPRTLHRSKSTVGSSIRNSRKQTQSAECLKVVHNVKKEEPTNEDLLDLTYNTYIQTCLMAAHREKMQKVAEQKLIQEVEDLQTNLIAVSDEINSLDIALEKIKYLKQTKQLLTQKIENYKNIKDSLDEAEIDRHIKTLEEDLRYPKFKQFKLPETLEEREGVNRLIQELSEELKAVPLLKSTIQPLVDVRTTLLKTKEYIDKEGDLKKKCTGKLEKAEELVYDELCSLALIENDKETIEKEK